jgi:mRNA interferase MazF
MARIFLNRGEIWYVKLDPTVGAEQQKTRRVVIISNDTIGKLPLKVIVPVTDWKDHYQNVPWMVKVIPDRINQLDKISAADAFQVRSVSIERFGSHVEGRLSKDLLDQIIEAVATVISEV